MSPKTTTLVDREFWKQAALAALQGGYKSGWAVVEAADAVCEADVFRVRNGMKRPRPVPHEAVQDLMEAAVAALKLISAETPEHIAVTNALRRLETLLS